jgi:hypothetical protein
MKKFFVVIVLLVLFLSACMPIKEIALDTINAVGRNSDGSRVTLVLGGNVEITAANQMDIAVLSVLGETLVVSDERCQEPETDETGLLTTSCFLDTVALGTTVNVTGTKRSAFLSWLVKDEVARRFIVVSEINP